MKEENESLITLAKLISGKEITIEQAERGKQTPYFCLQCGRQLQARKGSIKVHHFSHDPQDVQRFGKCTFKDETYRHKVAKEILQRIQQIKVPALYKFPPDGGDGQANKLRSAEMIHAHRVGVEYRFFEDENGAVQFTDNPGWQETQERNLLIQPDISFFDSNGRPLLLIELVATHKIDADKLAKIKRLGIPTIQVSIPKVTSSEIEQTFFHTNRTEWVYHHEQENAEYIPTTAGHSTDVPRINEFQRQLLIESESFKCTAAAVNNLVRAIEKHLRSEQHREVEDYFRGEISRVEKNTENHRQRLAQLQDEIQEGVRSEFSERRERLGRRDQKLRSRVLEKRSELETEENSYRPRCLPEIEQVEREIAAVEGDIRRIEQRFEEFGGREGTLPKRLAKLREDQRGIDEAIEREKSAISSISQEETDLPRWSNALEKRVTIEFKQSEDRVRAEFEAKERTIEREFEESSRQLSQAIKSRDRTGNSQLATRIGELLEAKRNIEYYEENYPIAKRYKDALQCFKSGAYKNWTYS